MKKIKVFNRTTNVEITDKETRFVVVDREGNVIVVTYSFNEYNLYFIEDKDDEFYRVEVIE